MAHLRKIQTDIEKLLKKLQEGIVEYDELYDKFQEASTQVLRERFGSELKKEIKKLQRFRETIKGHIANPDIKDKRQLEASRRLIETKMEDFKGIEREVKTKAYSKEGLANRPDASDTPQARTELWVKQAISDLREQIETTEFELQAEGRRRGKSDAPAQRLSRLRYHSGRLEQVLRLVTNHELDPEEVDDIEDDVQRFIEENNEEDFEDCKDIYDVFGLPETVDVAEAPPAAAPAAPPTPSSATKAAVPAPTIAAPTVATPSTAPAAAPAPAPAPAPAAESKDKAVAKRATDTPPSTVAKAPVATPKAIARRDPPAPPAAALTPPPAGPTAAVGATGVGGAGAGAKKISILSKPTAADVARGAARPPSETALDDDADNLNDETFGDDDDVGGGGHGGSIADLAMATEAAASEWGRPGKALIGVALPAPRSVQAAQAAASPPVSSPSPSAPSMAAVTAAAVAASVSGAATRPAAPSPTPMPPTNPLLQIRALEMSARNLPQLVDVEQKRSASPANPCSVPAWFPQEPHHIVNDPELYRRFDLDTMFFVFYHQPGTYAQYMAAKELKRNAFRFHKKYLTWFKRQEKPKTTNSDYEQGQFIYFDYEGGWCQRIKKDFKFHYSFLEDEDL